MELEWAASSRDFEPRISSERSRTLRRAASEAVHGARRAVVAKPAAARAPAPVSSAPQDARAGVDDDDDRRRGYATSSARSLAQRAAAIAVGTLLALRRRRALAACPGRAAPARSQHLPFSMLLPGVRAGEDPCFRASLCTSICTSQISRPRCHWNGYSWRHRTDAWGGRNPETWSEVDVALLGDSMIYGHGVEEEQTTAHFLRERLGVKVSNLGSHGRLVPAVPGAPAKLRAAFAPSGRVRLRVRG